MNVGASLRRPDENGMVPVTNIMVIQLSLSSDELEERSKWLSSVIGPAEHGAWGCDIGNNDLGVRSNMLNSGRSIDICVTMTYRFWFVNDEDAAMFRFAWT